MVVDSSAIVAIVFDEPERSLFEEHLRLATTRLICSATLVEVSLVILSRRNEEGLQILREVLKDMRIETAPLTAEHVDRAVDAFRRFGKGRHTAGLNFGDCLAYALAAATGLPLLYKGDDFAKTDVRRAA